MPVILYILLLLLFIIIYKKSTFYKINKIYNINNIIIFIKMEDTTPVALAKLARDILYCTIILYSLIILSASAVWLWIARACL